MDKIQENPHYSLLRYLRGDEKKLREYMGILSQCVTASDVAQKVIRPIYINENSNNLTSKDICKRDFYTPIASLASEKSGRRINAHTLYYHINNHVKDW